MRKREILGELDLTPGQLRLIGFHSFVNLINVLVLELEALERDLEKPDLFLAAREQFLQVLHAFRDETGELPLMQQLNEMRLILQADLQKHAPQATRIMRILEVAHMRIEEMAARHGGDNRWVRMSFIRLRHSFELVFTVMSERAGRRYRIVFHDRPLQPAKVNTDAETMPAETMPAKTHDQTIPVYRIILELLSPDEETVHMPLVLQDVLRDLAANARKYSDSGGRILARLEESDRELILIVQDNGRGIPEKEIERVVHFGERGSNTAPSETMGGGFGLTKAYSVVHTLGGRMWISSATEGPDQGTTIEIRIPLPAAPG